MTLTRISISAAIVFCLAALTLPLAWGDESTDLNRRVENLIEQLDSAKFSERVMATRQLQRLGAAGIRPLTEVVLQGNSDAADRAITILKRHFRSDSQELSSAAQQALRRIAGQENHPKASAAKNLLAPKSPSQSSPNFVPPIQRAPQIQLAPPIRQQNRISVSVKTINGKREVLVDENGRKFRFADEGTGLRVERPDDKGGVKTKKYKDEEALKKADKEAYEFYRRYAAGNGRQIQIQMNGQVFPRRLGPGLLPPQLPALPPGRLPQLQPPRRQIPNRIAPPRPAVKQPEPNLIEV